MLIVILAILTGCSAEVAEKKVSYFCKETKYTVLSFEDGSVLPGNGIVKTDDLMSKGDENGKIKFTTVSFEGKISINYDNNLSEDENNKKAGQNFIDSGVIEQIRKIYKYDDDEITPEVECRKVS